MTKRKAAAKKLRSTLKKEVHLPVPVPKNKVGEALTKKRGLPFGKYFKESWAELRKVTWPSRKESIKLTIAVILFTAVFTLFTALADVGIGELVERILL